MASLRRMALLILALSATAFGADILDRVAVSIENTVITATEVSRQIRITALMNNEEPNFSPANKRETADRLVDQALIRREIAISRYTSDVSQRAAAIYKEFRKRYSSDAAYQAALQKYGLTDQDVRAAFEWQATLLDFVEVRFRPGVSVPEEEIVHYYEEQIKPKGASDGEPSLEEARPQIEEILTQQRVDNALDRWLGQTRTQTRIRYRQEALQ